MGTNELGVRNNVKTVNVNMNDEDGGAHEVIAHQLDTIAPRRLLLEYGDHHPTACVKATANVSTFE